MKKALQICALIICFIGFIWQIWDLCNNFLEDLEGTSQGKENREIIKFPVIYVCLQEAFDTSKLHIELSKESYLESIRKFEITVKIWSYNDTDESKNLTKDVSYVHFWENGYCAKFKTDHNPLANESLVFYLDSLNGQPVNTSKEVCRFYLNNSEKGP